jgi:hypothetical protein
VCYCFVIAHSFVCAHGCREAISQATTSGALSGGRQSWIRTCSSGKCPARIRQDLRKRCANQHWLKLGALLVVPVWRWGIGQCRRGGGRTGIVAPEPAQSADGCHAADGVILSNLLVNPARAQKKGGKVSVGFVRVVLIFIMIFNVQHFFKIEKLDKHSEAAELRRHISRLGIRGNQSTSKIRYRIGNS